MTKVYIAPSSQIHNVGYYKLYSTNEGKNCNIITDYIIERLDQFANSDVERGYIDDTLYENEDRANKLGCTSYYAIHTNASSVPATSGVVCLHQTSTKLPLMQRTKSKYMADMLRDYIVELGRVDRGIKGRLNSTGGEYYADLRRPKMASVILEIDFHTNRDATTWLVKNQQKIGYKIANAIARIEGWYLYKAKVIAKDGLNVRTAPGIDKPLALTSPNPIPYGTTVYVYSEAKDSKGKVWCRINNNKSYWVSKVYLEK